VAAYSPICEKSRIMLIAVVSKRGHQKFSHYDMKQFDPYQPYHIVNKNEI